MKTGISTITLTLLLVLLSVSLSFATVISITDSSQNSVVGTPSELPFTLVGNFSNESTLYAWDEVQNYTLTEDLRVDRVADPTASYIGGTVGSYYIKAGTVVSSHYVQWDPVNGSVDATINLDSDIFAFITSDVNLANSDYLGRTGVDYGDFALRGLENGDVTIFNGNSATVSWYASSPGDWTRLITAYSPAANNDPVNPAPVPEPSTIVLLCSGLLGIAWKSKGLKK